jgi:hypothetical protein
MKQQVHVTVVVDRDDQTGAVMSSHYLASKTHEEEVLRWPSGGMEQIGFALLVEAVRREAMLDVILCLSREQGLLQRYQGDPQSVVQEIKPGMIEALHNLIDRLAEGALKEALDCAAEEFTPK